MGSLMEETARLKDRIIRAFTSTGCQAEVAEDIAFHLTDWDHNLKDLLRLYEQADQLSDEEILGIIYELLAHVPNHLAAAKKLSGLGPIEDIFQIGVFEEDPDQS